MGKELKVLVIRFSSIGDIVLTFHALRCLREKHPNAEIHFLTKSTYAELLQASTFHDKTLFFEGDLMQTRCAIRAEKYTHIIDLHNNLRTRLLTAGIFGARIKRVDKLNLQKWLLTYFKLNKLPKRHLVDRYIFTFKDLGIKNDQNNTVFSIPKSAEIDLKHYDLLPGSFLAVVMGGQFATKKFPVASLIQVLTNCNLPIALLGGEDEKVEAQKLMAALPAKNIHSFCGELSLLSAASVVSKANRVLTNDTGLMHITAMFAVPIISIWGNTVPAFGMYPYRPSSENAVKIHQVSNLACRPCSKIGYQNCPKGHFDCMNKQDLNAIADDLN